MKYLAILFLASCGGLWSPTSPKLTEHQHACVAAGLAIKDQSEAEGLPCWAVQVRLDHHVRTNVDCQAYWGDAGVDLQCEADGGKHGAD